MRRIFIVLALLAVAAAGASAQQRPGVAPGGSESRIALVIGNADYKDAPLANPMNDARAVAKALNESGFQVKLHTNLSQAQMRRAIREFGDELHARPGIGLFYFAGHGVQISNRNFLIPVGADIQREYEVEDQAVDAGAVLSMMQSAKARVNIVILDACRNNPFIREFRSTVNGLAPMQAPAGTIIGFSTAPGQTAIDGAGSLGLYTEHLVEQMAVPGVKIEDIFKNVRVGVQRASSGRQIPWENTSLTGDFYFRHGKVAGTADPGGRAQQEAIDRAVQQALQQRQEDNAARLRAQQDEIERAVMTALKRREQEQAAAEAARAARETQEARAAVDRLTKELAELRSVRDAEKATVVRAPAAPAVPDRPAGPAAPAPSAAAAPGPTTQVTLAPPATVRPATSFKPGGRAERPDVRVGEQWTYQVTDGFSRVSSNVQVEVTTVTGNHIYTTQHSGPGSSGAIDVWDRDWNHLRKGTIEYAPLYPSFQFPLEAGKSWRGKVVFDAGGGITLTHDVTANVIGWEQVKVPAGTFDAIKISFRGSFYATGSATGRGSINDVVWYAPSIGRFVRKDVQQRASGSTYFETQGAERNQQYESWELVEYKPN